MAAQGHKPAKLRRKNWQYSVFELDSTDYQGIDIVQSNGDHVEVTNIKPALHVYTQNASTSLPEEHFTVNGSNTAPEYHNLQQTVFEIYNNCQPTELPGYQKDAESDEPGIL